MADDETRPDDELTMILPPSLVKPEEPSEDEDEEPAPPPVEGSAELSSAMTHPDDDRDAAAPPALRSPWTAAPSTSFSAGPTPPMAAAPLASETTGPVPVVSAPAYAPAPAVAVLAPQQTDQVTCPECGTVAMVNLTRREADDFCRNCDYPLFWTPSKILLDRAGLSDDSLRRLPGTVGRVTVASVPCPHCAEPNQLAAVDCVRCGRPLRPVHFEPPPVPVYVPPPPEPEPEPERGVPWWVWLAITLMVITVTLVLLYAYNTWPFD